MQLWVAFIPVNLRIITTFDWEPRDQRVTSIELLHTLLISKRTQIRASEPHRMSIVRFAFVVILASFICVQAQRTSLDRYINEFRSFRESLFRIIGRSDTDSAYLWNLKRQKVQKPLAKTTQFFCDTRNGAGARSASIPESVHRLRPGDIDVVAAIGDSLTAGNGALATSILQVFIENKGVSWSIGGQGNWRKFLTVNIL